MIPSALVRVVTDPADLGSGVAVNRSPTLPIFMRMNSSIPSLDVMFMDGLTTADLSFGGARHWRPKRRGLANCSKDMIAETA